MTIHKRLSRLERIWVDCPIYFVTTCTHERRRELAREDVHAIGIETWRRGERLHGWIVGRYVMMPDHVHFFCASATDRCKLSTFVGAWKEWTAKFVARRCGILQPLWQEGFFDHLLRSSESYDAKWEYVRGNPVRAGLAESAASWPYQGELNDLRWD